MLAMALPMLGALLVSLITGEIQIADSNCPPHKYSCAITKDGEYLECVDCNFIPGRFV